MIDLSYHKKPKPEKMQPEEIACAIIAILLWTIIIFGIMAGA